mgnify:CR=1 FL=1
MIFRMKYNSSSVAVLDWTSGGEDVGQIIFDLARFFLRQAFWTFFVHDKTGNPLFVLNLCSCFFEKEWFLIILCHY